MSRPAAQKLKPTDMFILKPAANDFRIEVNWARLSRVAVDIIPGPVPR